MWRVLEINRIWFERKYWIAVRKLQRKGAEMKKRNNGYKKLVCTV